MKLSTLFGRGRRASAAPSVIPDDCVVWAIGDIHGRADLLAALLGGIAEDLRQSSATRRVVVGLGDYIDRGPASRGVLDQLCAVQDSQQIETHFLRGNHEDRFEAFMTDPAVGPGWCEYGGRETLWSYGVEPPSPRAEPALWTQVSESIRNALPERHRQFLQSQEQALVIGDYFFAHAGARPGVALDLQSATDLMWIRADFLSHTARFEKVVVHGHTPTEAVVADARRIGIDTGAYATGVLTGLRLEGQGRRLLQTAGAGAKATLTHRTLV